MFLNPVLLLFFMFNHFVSFSLACALWMLFNAFLPPLMIILLVLVMELHHSKARTCLHVYGFDDDFSQVPKFALQLLVDHNHLASFCEQINPLSSLRTIYSLTSNDDSMGYARAAQDAVNRMNVSRLQQPLVPQNANLVIRTPSHQRILRVYHWYGILGPLRGSLLLLRILFTTKSATFL